MADPVRVAHVVGKMVGGGVEQVVMNYYRHICRERIQFDFLVDADSTLVPREEIELLGGRVFEVPPYQRQVAYQRELTRLFRQERWPIVHSHINTLSVFPLCAAKKAGVPIRIAHGHSTSGGSELARNALKMMLRTQANRYLTHRMACSRHSGEWLFGREADFEVVRNAIDLAAFAPNAEERMRIRRELGIRDDQLLVGHIGRFVRQKNHAFLLHVFKEVLAFEPNAILALAGEGPLLSRMMQMAKDLGIDASVRFLGIRGDAPSLYQAFDVFCLPSLYEGFPVVGVECQASGTPTLVSSEITRELGLTPLLRFESLEAQPRTWARRLLALAILMRDEEGRGELAPYDIGDAALSLEHAYLRLLGERGGARA